VRAALLLAAAILSCHGPFLLQTQSPVPRADLGPAGASRSLVWVVPAAELRTCASVAADLRAAQAGRGGSLPLTVVYVGPHPEWMSAYLRSQRLASSLVPLSRAEYARRFGYEAVSALYLVDDRRIAGAVDLAGVGDARPRLRELIGGRKDGRATDAAAVARSSSSH